VNNSRNENISPDAGIICSIETDTLASYLKPLLNEHFTTSAIPEALVNFILISR
jgi:hypothetical protein